MSGPPPLGFLLSVQVNSAGARLAATGWVWIYMVRNALHTWLTTPYDREDRGCQLALPGPSASSWQTGACCYPVHPLELSVSSFNVAEARACLMAPRPSSSDMCALKQADSDISSGSPLRTQRPLQMPRRGVGLGKVRAQFALPWWVVIRKESRCRRVCYKWGGRGQKEGTVQQGPSSSSSSCPR